MKAVQSDPLTPRRAANVFRLRLVGPVLFYDLVRLGRRSRYFLIRAVYLLVLLAFLYFTQQRAYYQLATMGPQSVTRILAEFGEFFFFCYTVIQFLTVLLVTPALVAGCIAEEKERRTLEYLLATDLTNREIVLGKLISRLALLLLFFLAGLPVLSLSMLFGGISPDLMLCSALATLVTLLSVASVSMLISVYVQRVRDAVLLSYLTIVGFFVLWLFLEGVRIFVLLDGRTTVPALFMEGVVTVYRWGHPFYALYDLVGHVQMAGTLNKKAYELLAKYAAFHGLIIFLALGLSLLLLRWLYVSQILEAKLPKRRTKAAKTVWVPRSDGQMGRPVGFVTLPAKQRAAARRRPPVWDACMMWKELFVERSLRLGIVGEVLMSYFALALLFPVLVVTGAVFLSYMKQSGYLQEMQQAANLPIRYVGLIVSLLIYLGVAARACNSVTSERDRNTLESLLATPLEVREILFAKWCGSLYGVRFLVGVLVVLWVAGLISGGLHWLAIMPTALVVIVLSCFCASLGLYFGIRIRNALIAQISTLVVILGLGLAAWGLAFVISDETERDPYRHPYTYRAVILRSVSPLFLTQFFAFCESDLMNPSHRSEYRIFDFLGMRSSRYLHQGQVGFAFLLLSIYALAAMILYSLAVALFDRLSGRTGSRPDRARPPPVVRTASAKAPAAVGQVNSA